MTPWILSAVVLMFLSVTSLKLARRNPPVGFEFPRILMYHMISETLPGHRFRGLRVSPALFEQQLDWLSSEGWTFVTMTELRENYGSLPAKTVAITFDDGFLDNYTVAYPLLKKYKAKATLYLVIDRHGNEWQLHRKAHHNSGEILREQKLSDDQVRELISSGVFELGGHTISHINLQKENLETKTSEVVLGRQQLQDQFQVPVNSFAYPFGLYLPEDVELLKHAGFTSAVTTEEGIDTAPDFLQLKRIKVSGKDTFNTFKTRMLTGHKS